MRECGDCRECCSGKLRGNTRGKYFGEGVPCAYLKSEGCSIYDERPSQCRTYYCAWAQELFPLWMKPNESGVLISVERDRDGRQYLKVVSGELTTEVEKELKDFCNHHRTYAINTVSNRVIPIFSKD